MPVLPSPLSCLPAPMFPCRLCTSLYIGFTLMHTSLLSAERTKSHSMLLRCSKQTQDVGACLDISTARKKVVTSISEPTYQFIGRPSHRFDCWWVIYTRFQSWKLKYENILEAELASLPDVRFFLDGQVSRCLESSEVSTAILWSKWQDFCKPQANELRIR